MVQTLELPVLSLTIPNIHRLSNINADELSCMWTAFSKCKENLENGRRLENMSWRLWYRESTLKITKQQHVPIPVQHTSSLTEKHITPASFTKIISSLNEKELVPQQPALILKETPKPNLIISEKRPSSGHSKFFIDEESKSDIEDESDWTSDNGYADEEHSLFETTLETMTFQEEYSDDDSYETIDDDDDDINKVDETAFLLEFKKRSPSNAPTRSFATFKYVSRSGSTRYHH